MTDSTAQTTDKPAGPASRFGITIISGTLAIDQITKWTAETALEFRERIELLPILDLNLEYNTGVAFSFLRGTNSTVVLILVTIVTAIVLVMWARSQEGGRLATIGFGMIVGGAIGNIIDRLAYGHVVDFLLLYIGDRTLFIFNLADFALTLGPLLLIYAYLRPARRKA